MGAAYSYRGSQGSTVPQFLAAKVDSAASTWAAMRALTWAVGSSSDMAGLGACGMGRFHSTARRVHASHRADGLCVTLVGIHLFRTPRIPLDRAS